MKKGHLFLLSALMMLAAGTSCGSDGSTSGDDLSMTVSSAAETSSAAASVMESGTAPAEADSDKGSEAPADEPPAMEQAYKVLDCLSAEGRPDAIHSCGNIAAVRCWTADKDGQRTYKYYIVDTVNDKLLRTIDVYNSREVPLGIDAEGTLTAEVWKDWINETGDKQELVFYKADGSRSTVEYNDDLSFMYYDPSGQLYDLRKGIAKIGSDGSREIIFDDQAAEETRFYDPSRNRAVVSYLADSFSRPTTLMLIDTSTGEEIAELKAASDATVYGAGDYIIVSCIPDYDTYDQYISVYEKETGRPVWTSSEKDGGRGYYCYNDSGYSRVAGFPETSGSYDFKFLRVSDGAEGMLTLDIPDAAGTDIPTVTSAGRFISAVTVGDAEKNDTKIRLVVIDPAQVNYDGEIEKCEPYAYPEKNNKCSDKFSGLRTLADKIEEKYGVRVLIGDEVLDLEDTHDPYQFVSAESEDAGQDSYESTKDALNTIDEMLGRYPEDFFEKFRINGKGGLCLALAQDIVDKYNDTSFEAGGVTYSYGLWTVIVMRPEQTDIAGTIIHHEMFHAVEFIVSAKAGRIDEAEWAALNPEGFEYSTDFEDYYEGDTVSEYIYPGDDDPYFYREYSKVTPLEDRATLIEGIFTDAYADSPDHMTYIEDIQTKCPHLKAKYEYLGKWTSKLFGYVYWEKMLNIEL